MLTYAAAMEAVDHARRGDGPVLLECVTFRTLGHVLSDKNEYMDPELLAGHKANDPMTRFRARLLDEGLADEATLAEIEERVAAEVASAYEQAAADPLADPATVLEDVYAPVGTRRPPSRARTPRRRRS